MSIRGLPVLAIAAGTLLAVSAIGGGCSGSSHPPPPPTIGRQVAYTPPADTDPATLPLPKTADGATVLASATGLEVRWRRPAPGPLTALSACTRWISGCVSPDRSLDDCARSVPTCATDQPWNEPACCPASCFQRYAAARTRGTEAVSAFEAVYFDRTDSCVPGVSALLRGGP